MVPESSRNHQRVFVGLSYLIGNKKIEDNKPCFLIMYDLHSKKLISFSPNHIDTLTARIPNNVIMNNGYFGAMIDSLKFPYIELKLKLPNQEDTTFLGVTGDDSEKSIIKFLKQIKPYTLDNSL